MTDQAPRLRGRRGRDRRLAEAFEAAGRRTPRTPAGRADDAKGPRRRPPELAPPPALLGRTGQLEALARRLGRPRDDGAAGKVGTALRHVTYASMPHGAKSYLAAALASAIESPLDSTGLGLMARIISLPTIENPQTAL
ncbi:MAG: hypothetical protein ACXWN2_09210, partial [Candidatus Limnocylindrales bacterium]